MIGIAYAAEGGAHAASEAFYMEPEFWVAVAFVIFVALVFRKSAQIVGSALDARARRIGESIEQAQKLRDEAQAALIEHQKRQREAAKEAQGIIDQARVEAERLKVKAAADLEAQMAAHERHAMERIAQAEQKAMAEVRDLAVDIALAAASAVLKEQIDQGKARELVDQAIDQLPARMH